MDWSVEQTRLGRRPARRPPRGIGLDSVRLKVAENLLDDERIFDAARFRTAPPQAGQVSMSIPKTRFRRCAHVMEARRI